MWTLGNFRRFIRPGYLRVELPGVDNLDGLMASAYKAPDDSKLVIVALNAGSDNASVDLSVSGLPNGANLSDYSVYTTNASNDLRLTGTLSPSSLYEIPAMSTVTFVANISTNQEPPVVDNPVTTIPTSESANFKLVKRNASGFAIDGDNGGVANRSVELYTNVDHDNLTWTEIDRGNGYYAYQKFNTDVCMDGGNGGANRQDVTLQTCDAADINQHWQKVDVGSGHYQLQKRGTKFSIDGGSGGAIDQNIYLWTSASGNQNQHWRYDELP